MCTVEVARVFDAMQQSFKVITLPMHALDIDQTDRPSNSIPALIEAGCGDTYALLAIDSMLRYDERTRSQSKSL